MHENFAPLLTALPREELRYLARFLRGNESDFGEAIHAAVNVLSFGASLLHDDPAPTAAAAQAPPAHAQLAAQFDALAAQPAGGVVGDPAGAFPWHVVVPVLLDLVKTWLERRRPS